MTMPVAAPAPLGDAPASPFADAYARLTEVLPSLRVYEAGRGRAPRAGAGWVNGAELAAGGSAVEEFLAWDEAQVRRDHGRQARPDVLATFGLHRYAWPACLLVTVPWFLLRRVPRLTTPSAVSYHRVRGLLSVRVDAFACLPGDPAAGAEGAHVVDGEEALRAEARSSVAEQLAPVLEGFRPRIRRGSRALWGMVTDEITEGLWYVGHLLGQEARARREAGELLPGSTAPFAGGASFRELTGADGRPLSTRDRASCCLYYTLRPEDTCVTCPRTCDAERVARLGG